MAFDWREYLNLARYLVYGGNGFTQETAFRCAVSRAYYAAFCYARNYARDQHGFSPTYKSEDHWHVRKHFQDRGMTKVARKLDQLRQWRNSCDYDDTIAGVSSLFTSAITRAQEVLDRLVQGDVA